MSTATAPHAYIALKAYEDDNGTIHLRGTVQKKRLNIKVHSGESQGQPIQVQRLQELIKEASSKN